LAAARLITFLKCGHGRTFLAPASACASMTRMLCLRKRWWAAPDENPETLRPPEWGWDWVAVMTGAFSALWACVSKLGLRLAGFRADGTAIPESDSERCSGSDLS